MNPLRSLPPNGNGAFLKVLMAVTVGILIGGFGALWGIRAELSALDAKVSTTIVTAGQRIEVMQAQIRLLDDRMNKNDALTERTAVQIENLREYLRQKQP